MSAETGAAVRSLFEAAKRSPFHTCQWPHGDPQEDGFHYCGAPTVAPYSYCAHHVRMAFYDPDEEREAERAAA